MIFRPPGTLFSFVRTEDNTSNGNRSVCSIS
jgi:hypothetical protein